MLKKAARIWRKDGLITLAKRGVRFGYDTWIRPLLPKRVVSYNGVSVLASRLGDSLVPWHVRDIPGYESALVEGIKQFVETGDTVVIVGGGLGVSTVVAARQSGADGRVIAYEGGNETVEKVKKTVQLNDVEDRISVHHAIVGRAVSLRDDGTEAKTISPVDLPDCDVLVLDCEGAEIDILKQMEIRPNSIIVETHGMYGATEADVRDILSSSGYATVESMVAEERLRCLCEENGIYVLYSVEHT